MASKQRLDQRLVDLHLAPSRARARDAVLRGTVSVDGKIVTKPGQTVAETAKIDVDDPAQGYVSRAALKLLKAIDHFGVSAEDRICLDIGASTGGFTQVLLERGARVVHAIDVGHDQLHPSVATHPRVRRQDGLNARELAAHHLDGDRPQLLVSDVSFISLKLALPPALDLADDGAEALVLVKPQFEVGREKIGKGGLVAEHHAEASANELFAWFDSQSGWKALGLTPSPVKGGDGNREWLLHARKAES